MFSVVVGILAVIRFRIVVLVGSFSIIACSWLASDLPLSKEKKRTILEIIQIKILSNYFD